MSIEFNNLKIYRRESGLTQEQVAEKLNVSRQAVAKWENGDTLPDIESCIALADLYGTTVDILVRNLSSYTANDDGKKHIFGLSKMNDKGQITLPKKCREVFTLRDTRTDLISERWGEDITRVWRVGFQSDRAVRGERPYLNLELSFYGCCSAYAHRCGYNVFLRPSGAGLAAKSPKNSMSPRAIHL